MEAALDAGLGRCPVCGGLLVRDESGALVCTSCGRVFEEDSIDTGPDWRAYTAEERTRRTRASLLTSRMHNEGATTEISRSRDPRFQRLAALHARLRVEGHTAEVEAFQELNRLGALLGLPGYVIDTAAALLRRALSTGLLKRRGGSRLREWIVAVLVAASRLSNGPLSSIREAASAVGVNASRVARAYRELLQALGVKPRPPDASSVVPKLAEKLRLSPQAELLATRLLSALRQRGLTQGKPPLGLAAAAVYLSSILLDEKRNQTDVARAAGVTDATIRNRYRDLVDKLWIEVEL